MKTKVKVKIKGGTELLKKMGNLPRIGKMMQTGPSKKVTQKFGM